MKVTTLIALAVLYFVTVSLMLYVDFANSRADVDVELQSKLRIACDHEHKTFRILGYECR